jgi:chromosome segregation protein
MRQELANKRLQLQETTVRQSSLQEQITETEFNLDELLTNKSAEDSEPTLQTQLDGIALNINRLGAINLAAIEECEQISTRKEYLDKQNADLEEALATLENAIRKIDLETRSRFKETFEAINLSFQTLFPKLFGGGTAHLSLVGDDLLEAGVSVMAKPPGKHIASIHLLSGGEKAMTAIALVFSLFQLNPSPFCMLDEVDAPLDDANVGRFCEMVKEMSQKVQFIFISHNKNTITMANHLIGVTMSEPGVSRIVTVDIDTALAMADKIKSEKLKVKNLM